MSGSRNPPPQPLTPGEREPSGRWLATSSASRPRWWPRPRQASARGAARWSSTFSLPRTPAGLHLLGDGALPGHVLEQRQRQASGAVELATSSASRPEIASGATSSSNATSIPAAVSSTFLDFLQVGEDSSGRGTTSSASRPRWWPRPRATPRAFRPGSTFLAFVQVEVIPRAGGGGQGARATPGPGCASLPAAGEREPAGRAPPSPPAEDNAVSARERGQLRAGERDQRQGASRPQ